LRRGDIINIANGRRAGLAVILEPARDEDDPRPLVLTENRWAGRISPADYSGESAKVGSMTLPKRVEHRQPRVRRDLASALRSATEGMSIPRGRRSGPPRDHDVDPELTGLREELSRHPGHRLPDREEKVRLAERYLRIERDNEQIRQKVAAATNSLARTFDRIVVLLTERGFIRDVDGDQRVTDDGRVLARIYSESDLLVAECLRGGVWEGLSAAELAGVLSAVLYESRGDAATPQAAEVPTGKLRRALADTRRLAAELRADEQRHRITQSREPDEGFVAAVYRWATTGDLAAALDASDIGRTGSPMSAGDFVRWCRQVLDLADQVRNAAATPELRAVAKRAIADVRRGVVAVDAG
jgi:ATP-dependent RNA helicase HelY